MIDYSSPVWRAALGIEPLRTSQKYYAIDYTDGHVQLYTTEEQRVAKLDTDDPGIVVGIREIYITQQDRRNGT